MLGSQTSKKIFQPLNDIKKFKKFKLNAWTLEWENGTDFPLNFCLKIVRLNNLI